MFIEMDLIVLGSKEFCEVLTSNSWFQWTLSYAVTCECFLQCSAVFVNTMLVVNTKELSLTR